MEVKVKKSSSFSKEFCGFFYLLKVFGLAPYSFCQKTSKIIMKRSSYCVLVASVIIWLFFAVVTLEDFGAYQSGVKSKLVDGLWVWQFMIQSFMTIFLVSFNFSKRKTIESFINIVLGFDESLEKLNWNRIPKGSNKLNVCVAIFFLLFGFMIGAYFVYSMKLHNFDFTLSSFVNYARMSIFQCTTHFYLVLSLQFIVSVHCVCVRMKILLKNVR
jgi:hypothetical protein